MRLMAFADIVKGGVYIYSRVIPSFVPSFVPSFIDCPVFVGTGRHGSK